MNYQDIWESVTELDEKVIAEAETFAAEREKQVKRRRTWLWTAAACAILVLTILIWPGFGRREVNPTGVTSDVPDTKTDDVTSPGGDLIDDFDVAGRFQTGPVVTEEDKARAMELIRKFRSQWPALPGQEGESSSYFLSQPYPFLNLGEPGSLNAFLFCGKTCVGMLSFSNIGGQYSAGFTAGEIPEMTRYLAEGTKFVQISDGMRLWFVSEQESIPWNLKELKAGQIPVWQEAYAPYQEALELTEIPQ